MKNKKQFSKQILSIFLCVVMILSYVPMIVSAEATPTAYDGVPVTPTQITSNNYKLLGLTDENWSEFNGYYAIRNAKELYGFEEITDRVQNANGVLLQDIVINANGTTTYDWDPIAGYNAYYTGTFDGNGHYISGIYSTETIGNGMNTYFGGFICCLSGTVKNLIIKDSIFAPTKLGGNGRVGAIAGTTTGECIIENCRVENTTLQYSDSHNGILCGITGSQTNSDLTLKNCVSIVNINGGKASNAIALGDSYSNCYTSANDSHTCADVSVEHKQVNATCEYPGLSNYKYCLVCGNITSGSKKETAPTHTYQYSVEGNLFIETCSNGCGHRETATLSTQKRVYTYTGEEITPAIIMTYSDGWNGSTPTDIIYQNNLNVGTGTASVNIDGYTLSTTFRIVMPAGDSNNDGVYEISTADELLWFAQLVNDDAATNQSAVLMNDIDMDGVAWSAIAAGSSVGYTGTFDGQGKAIKNLNRNAGLSDGNKESLFSYVGEGGIVKNIVIDNADVWTDNDYELRASGIVAMVNGGTISSCIVNASSVQQGAYDYLGGIAGINTESGIIQNCAVVNSKLTRRWGGTSTGTMGGITQANNGLVKNCYTYACSFGNGTETNGAIIATGNVPQNCYYYTTSTVDDTYGVAMEQLRFNSGEVTYLLNGSKYDGTLVWYQTLPVDKYPQFCGSVVYYNEGKGTYSNHIHNWSYKAEDGSIIATCNVDGCDEKDGGSVTLVAPTDTVYDNTSKDATLTFDNWQLGENAKPTISYNETDRVAVTNKDIVATITLGDKTVDVIYQIKAASISGATVSADDADYTGSALTPDVTVVLNNKTLTKDTDYAVSYSNNTNAGTATVTVKGKGNYEGTATGTFTINDTTDPTGEIKIKENSWKKFLNWISFGLFYKENVDVVVTADGTGSEVDKVEYLFFATALNENNLPADGWTIVTGNNGKYTFTIEAQNRGAVYVKITDKGGNVAVINSDGIVVYTDSKAVDTEKTYTFTTKENVEYKVNFNGNTVASVKCGDTTLNSTQYTVTENGIKINANYIEDNLKAGEYNITVTVNPLGVEYKAGDNPATVNLKLVVENATFADGDIIAKDCEASYDGGAHSITVNAPEGATVFYKVGNGAYSTENPAYKDAGTYTVAYKVTMANYNDVEGTAEVKITKALLTVTADDSSKTYGDDDPATLTWRITEGTLVGTDTLEHLSISRAEGKNAGDYAITVRQTEGANPNYDITFKNGTFTIHPKEIDISWEATNFLPYNGSSLVPKANATNLLTGDECILTTEVVETADGAGIIPGTWTAKVTALSNPNYKLPASGERVTANFEIVTGNQNDTPVISGVNETVDGKGDGKITGVDSTMEYRKEGETTYTAINGTEVTGLHDGVYYVRYAAKTYYNPSPYAQVTIGVGRKLTITVPQNQVGYTLTVDKNEVEYMGGPTIKLIIHEGYSKTENFAVKMNSKDMNWGDFNQIPTQGCKEDIVITVEGVADITPSAAEISIQDNKWNQFWNNVTFGLFFKEMQDVTIKANDKGSGVKSIEYYLASGELSAIEVEYITEWIDYEDKFKIDPDNKYVIYTRITDNAGNIAYINSDGLVLDKTQAVVEGLINGGTYYGQLVFTVADELAGVKSVAIDGADVTHFEGQYVINGDNAEHTVVVTDNADNVTEYKVTVYKNHTVTYKADGKVVSTLTVGHGQNVAFPSIPKKDGYVGKWDRNNENITADTVINAVYTKLADIVPDDVNSEDKTQLEESKKQLQDMLKDGNYTDEDKKDIQDAIDEIDKALAELNEPAKDNSPQTGDSLQLWMWFAVLFVSGSGVFTLIIIHRKRSK